MYLIKYFYQNHINITILFATNFNELLVDTWKFISSALIELQ